MRIIVRPKHERGRAFKYLVPAMRFAEAARARQGDKPGYVTVAILDGRWPHDFALFGRHGSDAFVSWRWVQT